ncbi:MAG TPA: TonB-dependent receptor [Sphingobium sp.]
MIRSTLLSRTALSLGLCALPVIAATPALAQDDATSPPIIVLGGTLDLPPGTPAYGQSVIDRDRLDSAASGRVEDVLRDVAGFSQFRRSDSRSANPSAQGANLRSLGGNAASRTLVLLDGVPMADPFFGYIPYAAIVPDRLSGIRVTRGGGEGAFGSGAVAGTIEMASATRADLPLLSASALYGSRDAQEVSAALSPDLGAGFLTVSGRYERGDGFQTTPASQWTPATAAARYESWSAGVRAVAPISDTAEVQARVLVYRDDRTLRFQGADSHAEGQDASIRLISRGDWQVDALAYVQARNFSNVVISSSTFRKTLDQRNTPALGLGGKIELRPRVGADHLLRFGVDSRYANGAMVEDAYNANLAANPVTARRHAYGQQLTVGGFVEDDWTPEALGGKLVLTAGGRIDRWTIRSASLQSLTVATGVETTTIYPDRSGWEAGGRAGALWKPTSLIALRAAAYTGFRLPTLNELYRGFTVFPVVTNANPNLKPERLRGAEVGLDLTPARGVSFSITAFDNRLDDAIANVTTAVNVRTRQNVSAIEAQGIELTAAAHVGTMHFTGTYAYSYSKVRAAGTALDGLDPAQSPRHAASATLAWEPKGGARLAATLRYTGRQYEDDLNIDTLPDALTLDGFARIPLGHDAAIIGRVENLFDAKIYTRRVSTPTLSEDLGTPQTFWIGVSFGLGRSAR